MADADAAPGLSLRGDIKSPETTEKQSALMRDGWRSKLTEPSRDNMPPFISMASERVCGFSTLLGGSEADWSVGDWLSRADPAAAPGPTILGLRMFGVARPLLRPMLAVEVMLPPAPPMVKLEVFTCRARVLGELASSPTSLPSDCETEVRLPASVLRAPPVAED